MRKQMLRHRQRAVLVASVIACLLIIFRISDIRLESGGTETVGPPTWNQIMGWAVAFGLLYYLLYRPRKADNYDEDDEWSWKALRE